MARIRSFKPEIWTSEQFVECSVSARLMFMGMWSFCDDRGIHPASLKRLKMEVFPSDPYTDEDIQEMIDQLISVGLLCHYSVNGKGFWHVTGWHHQKIDKPTYRYPTPDQADKFDEPSSTPRRALVEASPTESSRVESSLSKEHPTDACGEIGQALSLPPPSSNEDLSEFEFPVVGKKSKVGGGTWTLTAAKLREYREAYPSLDVDAEMVKARQWCRDNPRKRKTAGGMLAFLTNWLNRQQNQPRAGPQTPRPTLKSAKEIKDTDW